MSKDTEDRVKRYIIVNKHTGRIVATCGGTHATMERHCDRLDWAHRGGADTFIYDDAIAASEYLPQVGHNLGLTR